MRATHTTSNFCFEASRVETSQAKPNPRSSAAAGAPTSGSRRLSPLGRAGWPRIRQGRFAAGFSLQANVGEVEYAPKLVTALTNGFRRRGPLGQDGSPHSQSTSAAETAIRGGIGRFQSHAAEAEAESASFGRLWERRSKPLPDVSGLAVCLLLSGCLGSSPCFGP